MEKSIIMPYLVSYLAQTFSYYSPSVSIFLSLRAIRLYCNSIYHPSIVVAVLWVPYISVDSSSSGLPLLFPHFEYNGTLRFV
ncbi:hypothetical protein BKA60DRAFT_549962, partial [Fusarium oxysporum]